MLDGNGGQSRLQHILMWFTAVPVLAYLLIAVVPTLAAASH